MASVYTIAAGVSFVDHLAAGLLARAPAEDPAALSATTVLLPTRRAGRALKEAFLRQSGGRPVLLPRLLTLGDSADAEDLDQLDAPADELVPLAPLERQVRLARLIAAAPGGADLPLEQALGLAAELGRLLDQVATEGLSWDRLPELVPAGELAAHWQVTLDFLTILTKGWPALLADLGAIDAAQAARQRTLARAARWAETPPGPVVAAGSTGSVPATAELLATIASLPEGAVVLPGLDRALDPESWEKLPPSHPQYGLKRLLERLETPREAVADWPAPSPLPGGGPQGRRPPPDRARLIAETFRPAATTDRWDAMAPLAPQVLDGLTRLDCPTPREEAAAIALLLRRALEEVDQATTCALVTPDRGLARRVAAEMGRWGVQVADSAGRPLAATPVGAFLRLLAEAAAEDLAPLPLLALLKHPLAAGGQPVGRFRARVRRLERAVLRGPRPGPGIRGLQAALALLDGAEARAARGLAGWLDALQARLAPLTGLMATPRVAPDALLNALFASAEALAADSALPGPARLWRGDDGEAAAAFAAEASEAARLLDPLAPRHLPGLLDALLAGRVVRPAWGDHPRLFIWGPLEARLQQVDVLILGGLNAGTWPADSPPDPWMSAPMRTRFGLPPAERRVGLAAHDVAQGLAAGEVWLTRAERVDGTPSVPSRWLLRLDAALAAGGLAEPWQRKRASARATWLAWAAALDRPDAFRPATPPRPAPPLAARPTRLSVTRIEEWMRDPYACYARHVLRLKALDPLDAEPGPAEQGTLIHAILEAFVTAHPSGPLPADAARRLHDLGASAFAPLKTARPGVHALWWPRFLGLIDWLIARETERRPALARAFCEVEGELDVGGFVVRATADRVERLADGRLAVIDYKTGTPPSAKEVAAGFAPQLPLEAAIARAGGFSGVPAGPVAELAFWKLSGGPDGGTIRPATAKDTTPDSLAEAAVAGLKGLVAAFADPKTPYEARPHPGHVPRYSDYLHLARVAEWADADGEAE
ncbi:double-strand break repair protein AddB [Roseospirillum parvum]|uniref:ATP-dependent helicase/nuclease subunit B n=1 Tax=Roseospirillum parvum TaxID=83401 RepID=A0A1G7WQQ4_9PROT|nr:double-strand break repair protein AddB [Roseospirillum parvum]SDG74253.1 ATP-dependent helicase/nuclease subunit B [Roseospirillum parvum]